VQPRLIDPRLDAALTRDGYAVVPMLEDDEVRRLRDLFEDVRPAAVTGFSASPATLPADLAVEVSAAIAAVVVPRLDAMMHGFRVLGGAFLAKGSGDGGELGVHQDWTCVDESASRSLNVWCALGDIGRDDGGLEVVPGSHRWFRSYRSPTVPSVHLPFSEDLTAVLRPVAVRAGEAVCYDHRLFHGSRANRSGNLRLVAQVGVSPIDDPVLMCFPGAGGSVEVRRVDPSSHLLPTAPTDADPLVASVVPPPPVTGSDLVRHAIRARRRARWDALVPPRRRR
jgi:hypothetical protein